MRVISGKYKRRRFDVPHSFKARPTTDFAKENVFNVLSNNYIDFEDTTVLDLFAGTGSITIELLSRGCKRVVSVERDRDHCLFIKKVLAELKDENCMLIRTDALRYISSSKDKFDFIFADPPYALKELEDIPSMVFKSGILDEGGILVLEHGKTNNFEGTPYFVEHREYGSVNFSFFVFDNSSES